MRKPDTTAGGPLLSRRAVLGLVGAGAAVAAGGGLAFGLLQRDRPISPTGPEVAAAEASRRRTGRTATYELRAAPTTVDLGGRQVRTWAYNGRSPSDTIRVVSGDELRIRLINELPEPTTVHWHGLALRSDMDGVPGLTMPMVAPGGTFDYAFVVPQPGTYWFHPHVGAQLDTGLYAPLIIDDPQEPGGYDDEAVLVLDDWTDGWGPSPGAILAEARRNGMAGMAGMPGMEQMGMPSADQPLGSDTGDVAYPAHLINGRPPADPAVLTGRPGRRIRLRLINAASDTAYRFAVGGHRLTITHTDGFPVNPRQVDTLIIGMGERYDVLVTAGDGTFPVVAVPEGKKDQAAFAVLRTAAGTTQRPDARPEELDRQLLSYTELTAATGVELGAEQPDRQLKMLLTMADGGRRWLVNGKAYGEHEPLTVDAGERVRILIDNQSMMFHPMHLHGHTFALSTPDGRGIRKDTVNVLPMQQLAVDLDTDNPGQWLAHCHNTYHAELGMATTMSYTS
jgi:FtsP/CotA-like multicopper oxidase with cupredoxin domain